MRTIQEVGTEILTNNPKSLYIMVGTEYGVKMKYINLLKDLYGCLKEFPDVESVLNIMNRKHIIPLVPCVYVVRYDETFVSSLNEVVKKKIQNTNVIGTIVCIYENDKHTSKLDKYLPEYTVSVDSVSDKYLEKYLHQDFPGIADRFVNIAIKYSNDYNQAQNMCRAMKSVSADKLYKFSDEEIASLFGHSDLSSDMQIRTGVAARNFKYLIDVLDNLDNLDNIYYVLLQTLIELDKLKNGGYVQSDLKAYVDNWKREDIYYMFVNVYSELKRSRTYQIDTKSSLILLFSMLQFNTIPYLEGLK